MTERQQAEVNAVDAAHLAEMGDLYRTLIEQLIEVEEQSAFEHFRNGLRLSRKARARAIQMIQEAE